jgi:hypothetical protein
MRNSADPSPQPPPGDPSPEASSLYQIWAERTINKVLATHGGQRPAPIQALLALGEAFKGNRKEERAAWLRECHRQGAI